MLPGLKKKGKEEYDYYKGYSQGQEHKSFVNFKFLHTTVFTNIEDIEKKSYSFICNIH